jgi:hypothetical protein
MNRYVMTYQKFEPQALGEQGSPQQKAFDFQPPQIPGNWRVHSWQSHKNETWLAILWEHTESFAFERT